MIEHTQKREYTNLSKLFQMKKLGKKFKVTVLILKKINKNHKKGFGWGSAVAVVFQSTFHAETHLNNIYF